MKKSGKRSRRMRRALDNNLPHNIPMRYGLCSECHEVSSYAFTGHRGSIPCSNKGARYPFPCTGRVYLPQDDETQRMAEAAYRIGGPAAARPVIEDFYRAFME